MRLDWVVIPPNWWENVSMVIPKAFTLDRPMVGPHIAGRAKNSICDVNGVHVSIWNTKARCETRLRLASYIAESARLPSGITRPNSHADRAKALLDPMSTLASENLHG